MGKWTPNFTDDVLHAKISNLVSGSIRRAAVEKEPTITYENFVDELDTGDSFTASLVDILVKELADRRTRPNAADRKAIADRTIRGLRVLASNARGISNRPGGPRARRLTDYFTASPNELEMDEEEDEYEVAMENPSMIEGARINTDLHDAYTSASGGWGQVSPRRATESPPVSSDEWPLPPLIRSTSSTNLNRPWQTGHVVPSTSSSSNLTRQPSIRRQRSRMVDFHEYANRRRSNAREHWPGAVPHDPVSVTEPREPTAATVRRFFPFPRARRAPSSANQPWLPDARNMSPDSDESSTLQYFMDPASGAWFPQHPPPSSPPQLISAEVEDREEMENLLRAPRLRRGGIRAPESVLSRRASPMPIPMIPVVVTHAPASPRRDDSASMPANEEPVAYPTPGSTENESLS
ncbi:hypothetical protein BDN70DRAFT_992472 [Pholiota conissans]|uniref:Uncharacterized protein n=1 Tax=Pholiota conissans TaxID=109636 RepID=A0A9P6D2H4_9AGAR|nr:hypothetical protein BDN70DRAFT_992472 [Pholiota conissans]